MVNVDSNSLTSLYIECKFNDVAIGQGTGFIIKHGDKPYLITNWHVLTGRDPITKRPLDSKTAAADPDEIIIWHHLKGRLGTWIAIRERVLDSSTGKHLWYEHPKGSEVDVVALPLTIENNVDFHPLDLALGKKELYISPSDVVSIIGFPLGTPTQGKLPFWITGFVASDIEIDYDDKPIFYINATTEQGMSGSPVIAKREGTYSIKPGSMVIGSAIRFLGVYSSRKWKEYQIGVVWKPIVIDEILSSIV